MRTRIVYLLLWAVLGAKAQETRPWEQYLNEVMTQDDLESSSWEETYELLCELEQHPLDINRATRESWSTCGDTGAWSRRRNSR